MSDPFDPADIEWRAGSTTRDKKKAQALVYAQPRVYEDRLDGVCAGDWSVLFRPWGEQRIICELTIHGVTRSSTGEFDSSDHIAQGTTAEAQAFKRACSKFGLGRYLYDIPLAWVAYDEEKKRLLETPELPAKYLPRRSVPPAPTPRPPTPTNAELREAVDEVLEAELPTGPELTGEAAMAAAKSRGVTKGVPTLSQTKAADLVTALRKLGVKDYFKLANEVTGRQLTALTELTTAEAKRVHEAAVVKNQQPTERIGSSSAAQLHRVVDAAGVQDHYDFASEVLGREVTSYADLTLDEAFTVNAAAKKYRPPVN